MSAAWWEDLSPLQMEWYGAHIDSRVRLLGESYGQATRAVQASESARESILSHAEVTS